MTGGAVLGPRQREAPPMVNREQRRAAAHHTRLPPVHRRFPTRAAKSAPIKLINRRQRPARSGQGQTLYI